MLTNEDKLNILNQHKRNITMSKYNTEVSLLAENATSVPNATVIADFNDQIKDFDKKLAALDAEIESLS